MPGDALLLVGKLTHSRPEWHALGELDTSLELKAFESGTREEFIRRCDIGEYGNVVALYRSNHSTKVTGPFDSELVSHLPRSLRFICHNGAGYDSLDPAACTSRGIQISNTPEVNTPATADIAIFLLLGALRQAHMPMSSIRMGQWQGSAMPLGRDPQGKTLGILGMGSIGRAVATRARTFGMRVQYHNRRRLPATDENGLDAAYVEFDTLIATSDVLSLNCQLNAETRHIIGSKQLRQMKKGAIIVNTARGGLIDEKALVEALREDHIGGVGLDAFEEEPKIADGLMEHPRAFLVPHIGTSTFETQRAAELLALENLKSAVTEGRLLTRISEQENMTQL